MQYLKKKYFILTISIVSIAILVLISNAVTDSFTESPSKTLTNNKLFTEPQNMARKIVVDDAKKNLQSNGSTALSTANDRSISTQSSETNKFKNTHLSARFTSLNKRTFNPEPPLTIININAELLNKKNLSINLPFIGETNAVLSQKQETEQLTHAIFRFTDKRGSLSVSFNDDDIKELTLYDTDANRVFTGNQAKDGSISFREKNIDNFICNDFSHKSTSTNISSLSHTAAALAEIEDNYFTGGFTPTFADITSLQSKPSASKVIYIDNLGGTVVDTWWNVNMTDGAPISYDPYDIDGNTTTFASIERILIYAAWAELAEDYAPFEVNVTTDIAVYDSAAQNQRSRIIATKSNDWLGFGGGVALLDVFGKNNFCSIGSEYCSIGWTFNSGFGSMGITHSHEAGHQMGLSHDGNINDGYYSGHGNWGTIMGAPFNKDFAQWNNGSYPNATNTEDDFTIISNKLGVTADDVGDTNTSATPLVDDLVGLITPKGSGSTIDKDVFTFISNGGSTAANITVRSLFEGDFSGNGGVNLSAKISLKNASGTTIQEKLPTQTSTNNNFEYNGTLPRGTYYLTIEPQSYDSNLATGFDEYGNGGYYQILSNVSEVQNSPDLIINSISLNSSQVLTGSSITLDTTVKNIGGANSNLSNIRYFRSNDKTIDTNDTQIGINAIASLSVNGTNNESTNISAPNTAGTYYYGACADTVINEITTNNNCSTAVTVNVVSPPDLIIESFAPSTTTISTDTTLKLSARIKNNGGFISTTSNLRYYHSLDNVISTSDIEVGSDTVGLLNATDNEDDFVNITAPTDAGTYYYGVCVDTVTNETATTNNCSDAVAVSVTEQTFPDLLIDSLSVSKVRLTTETPLDIGVSIRNAGSEPASDSSIKFYISTNNIISFQDEELVSFNISGLGINNYAIESTTINTFTVAGSYYFGACVAEDINEQDTNNNCSAGISVEVVKGYEADIYEPNDNANQSLEISNNEAQTHSIHTLDDEDWLSFVIEEDTDNLTISIASLNADNIEFELFDETLNSIDNIADASLENLEVDSLAAGTYYVQVHSIDGENAIESYEVSLSIDEVEDDFCFPIKAKNGKLAMICL